MHTRRTAFWQGVRAELPILVGVLPFGMVYGAAALKAGLPAGLTQAMSGIIFAGSAQFVTVQLVAAQVPGLVIVLTAILLNLRHLLYSASIAPYLRHLPPRWRWLLAYLLTDEAYAIVITHYRDERVPHALNHWFFLGAGLALWTTWQLSTIAGILLGAIIPASWSLDFAIPLTFIALVIPAIRDRASGGAALTAGILAVVLTAVPLKLGLLTATLVGMGVGVIIERQRTRARSVREPSP
jgi:4-azaleucine resistance transporter AzlC